MPMSSSLIDLIADSYKHAKEMKELQPTTLSAIPVEQIKTQKAKGYRLLNGGLGDFGVGVTRPWRHAYILPQNKEYVEKNLNLFTSRHGWFARPCPVTPRHGFVDSREVGSVEQINAVFGEARLADPEAELLIVPKLSGHYSGVVTNVGVTFGHGNAGVTDGGESFLIPTPMTSKSAWHDLHYNLVVQAGIKDTGYAELVESENDIEVVQFRDGPEQPTTKNFIPKTVVIRKVIRAEDTLDLLSWERLILSNKGKKGVVVWLQYGSLSSHWAVHAIAAGIPVITGYDKPQIGQKLQPPSNRIAPFKSKDYKALSEMMQGWLKRDLGMESYNYAHQAMKNKIATAVASIQAMSAWDNSPHLLQLRAFAATALVRFIASAALGELRHWHSRRGPGGSLDKRMLTDMPLPVEDQARGSIYAAVGGERDLSVISSMLTTAYKDFKTPGWEYRTNYDSDDNESREYGYGGPNWASVAKAGEVMAKAMKQFMAKPNKTSWTKVIMAANNAINTVHNGGRALNKWISDAQLSHITRVPVYGLCNSWCAQVTLGLATPAKGGL